MNFLSTDPKQRRTDRVISSKTYEDLLHQLQDPFQSEINQLINSSSKQLDPSIRRSLISTILSDLVFQTSSSASTSWSDQTFLSALICLKLLGRSQIGTDDLLSHFRLLARLANLIPLEPDQPISPTTFFEPSIVQESLRILANALFLHPLSRSSIDLLPTLNSLVELAIGQLVSFDSVVPPQTAPQPNSDHHLNAFLASRILFLITAVPSNLVIEIVEATDLVNYFGYAFKKLLVQKDDPPNCRLIPPDALLEHLKLIFNLMVNYSKSFSQLDLPPFSPNQSPSTGSSMNFNSTSKTSHDTSPLVSPSIRDSFKKRLVSQINFKKIRRHSLLESWSNGKDPDPANPSMTDQAGTGSRNPISPRNPSFSKTSSRFPSLIQDGDLFVTVTDPQNQVFSGLLPYLVHLFLLESIPQPPNLKPPLISYIHTFLNFAPSAYCFFSKYDDLPTDLNWTKDIPPVINKLILIIDRVTEYYCPNDPDHRSVREKCHQDNVDLDIDLSQVVLLTANLISPHNLLNGSVPAGLTKESREALIEMIVPSNIDRSTSLLKHNNFIGRILRLMNSVGFESLKRICGDFLRALYEDDTDRLASQVGYGPLAGYLLSIGKPVLTPENESSAPVDINPITGTHWPAEDDTAPMTELEKEQEAERLCELFDRMNRSGVISVKDPRQMAVESGRFKEIERAVEIHDDQEEAAEEAQALKELQQYKERKGLKKSEP